MNFRGFVQLVALLTVPTFALGVAPARAVAGSSDTGCQLQSAGENIRHVVSITFDNTHFTRDNPNVPSDLEFMPNVLNFIRGNGTLLANYHTPLISHTATDILTSLTGVYGDRHGQPVSNSYRYFNPDGSSSLGVSFAYWTAPIFNPIEASPTNTTFTMLTADGKNAPAPWVPFTRAGCDFGAVSTANIVLENTAIDIPTVFGAGSPEAAEVKANPSQGFADFVGIAVHCAQTSSRCSAANNGRPDLLPNEPGGYEGFSGLFGHKYVAPQISQGPLTDLNGNVIINQKSGTPGFPGFDSVPAAVSLAYVAAMQEHGIPVTYAYITDSHDRKVLDAQDRAYGPGEAGYVANLKANDDAFGKFFARLAAAGIDRSNTLFLFTSDEGDHFAGVTKTNCDGVTVLCTYGTGEIGEANVNTKGLLASQEGITTPFRMHSDVAPTYYITGNPGPAAPVTRELERAVGDLQATNPFTNRQEQITEALADPVEMKLLHMITADPTRTPTFTQFALPDYYLFDFGPPNCAAPCVSVNPKYAWNHGTFSPDISTTWLGLVGPGVKAGGIESSTWSDHTDLRPTTLSLLGLQDDYSHQGRVLVEVLKPAALQPSLQAPEFVGLAGAYKQINAPVGQLSLDSLKVSTRALMAADGDPTYGQLLANLSSITDRRNALASEMEQLLEGAAFRSQPIDPSRASDLITQARALLSEVRALAG